MRLEDEGGKPSRSSNLSMAAWRVLGETMMELNFLQLLDEYESSNSPWIIIIIFLNLGGFNSLQNGSCIF